MARKPTAPGANGRRKRSVAWSWVRAGGARPPAWSADICGLLVGGVCGSGGEPARADVEAGLGEEARRGAGRASAADVAAGEHEVVLGTRGGDVEQPPFLFEVLGVGALQRAPRGEQLFLAAEQQ